MKDEIYTSQLNYKYGGLNVTTISEDGYKNYTCVTCKVGKKSWKCTGTSKCRMN